MTGLWQVVRWPIAVLAVAVAGIVAATVLDQTSQRELALPIGAPALTILLPAGLIWLAAALVMHALRRRRQG
jgi:hypothetical protein